VKPRGTSKTLPVLFRRLGLTPEDTKFNRRAAEYTKCAVREARYAEKVKAAKERKAKS
jgi:hypothetical protein